MAGYLLSGHQLQYIPEPACHLPQILAADGVYHTVYVRMVRRRKLHSVQVSYTTLVDTLIPGLAMSTWHWGMGGRGDSLADPQTGGSPA